MVPCTLVAQDQVEKYCVVEFSITGAEDVPQSLLDVNTQLPEGTLKLSVGLGMSASKRECVNALCIHEGSLREDGISWIGPHKFFLDSAEVKTLRVRHL